MAKNLIGMITTGPRCDYDVVRQKFTAKERDAETGLDYFGARYMSAAQGRWISPDAPFADEVPASTITAPSVSWVWDRATNGKGRLKSIASGSTTV